MGENQSECENNLGYYINNKRARHLECYWFIAWFLSKTERPGKLIAKTEKGRAYGQQLLPGSNPVEVLTFSGFYTQSLKLQ